MNQMYLMAMLEMGIPKHKAEVALTETGNVGVEVATEWLFSAPESAQFEHYASDTGAPQRQQWARSRHAAGQAAVAVIAPAPLLYLHACKLYLILVTHSKCWQQLPHPLLHMNPR